MPPGTRLKVGSHELTIISYISEGGFAHIYKVRISPSENNSDIACLKRVLVKDKAGLNLLRTEVKVMQRLIGRPNIVQYYDSHALRLAAADSHQSIGYEVLVLMELCPNKSLLDFMNTRLKTKLSEIEILKIMYDISLAVAQLHYLPKPLIHRDIKIENVLIDAERNFKLCDFGSTCRPIAAPRSQQELQAVYQDIVHQTTPQYRAPEMIDLGRGLAVDEKSDVWALGVFLYKLCFYITPFEQQGEIAILSASFQFPPVPRYSLNIKNLIIIMLQVNPAFRPNIYQVVDAVCKISNLTVPIQDIYDAGTYKIPQIPDQGVPAAGAAGPQAITAHSIPTAGASPGQYYKRPPPSKPQDPGHSYTPPKPLLQDPGHPYSSYPHSQSYPAQDLAAPKAKENELSSLTQSLLLKTTEMIEGSHDASHDAQKEPDLLDNADIRYPSVDQLNSFMDFGTTTDGLLVPQHHQLYPDGVDAKSTSALDDRRKSSHLAPNKSNVSLSLGPGNYSSTSIDLTKSNSSDLYTFEASASRPFSDKSKVSRPVSFLEENSPEFNAFGSSGYTGNSGVPSEFEDNYYSNYDNPLLDFDEQAVDFLEVPNRPKTPSKNPFPFDESKDKNPWAGKSPFPVIPKEKQDKKIATSTSEDHINELLIKTSSIVNGFIDNDDLKSPAASKFQNAPPNDPAASHVSPTQNKSLSYVLSTRTKTANPVPRLENPLDISLENLHIRNPDNYGNDLLELESPNSYKIAAYGGLPAFDVPEKSNKSAVKIRELVNSTQEVEVDLSSNSTFDDEIAIEEENGDKYLTKIQTSKSKSSTTSKTQEPEIPNPVDALFYKDPPKKSRFARLRKHSDDTKPATLDYLTSPGELVASPVSIDMTTKKKLGNIFSDSDNDSVGGDAKPEQATEEDIQEKKRNRRKKVKSFLGSSFHR